MDKNRLFFILAILIAALITIYVTARVNAEDGTVVIQSVGGSPARIIRPSDGGVSTLWTFGEKYYVYNLQPKTQIIEISATSREGAAFKIKLFVIYKPLGTDESIKIYFTKYGMNEKSDSGIVPILSGYLNNQAVKELVKYSAYDITASLNNIQTDLVKTSKPELREQFMVDLETHYFIDRPVFDDGKIEAAAAEAAAYEKLKAAGIPKKEQAPK